MLKACLLVRSASQVSSAQVSGTDVTQVLPMAGNQRRESDSGNAHTVAEDGVAAPLLRAIRLLWSVWAWHLLLRGGCLLWTVCVLGDGIEGARAGAAASAGENESDDHGRSGHFCVSNNGVHGARAATAGDNGESIRLLEVNPCKG